MNRFGLMGVSALSLMLAFVTTATAQDRDTRHVKRAVQGTTAAGDPNLPVENALRWGYSQGYSHYLRRSLRGRSISRQHRHQL
jgi:hypothetical protein